VRVQHLSDHSSIFFKLSNDYLGTIQGQGAFNNFCRLKGQCYDLRTMLAKFFLHPSKELFTDTRYFVFYSYVHTYKLACSPCLCSYHAFVGRQCLSDVSKKQISKRKLFRSQSFPFLGVTTKSSQRRCYKFACDMTNYVCTYVAVLVDTIKQLQGLETSFFL
jgi:hypothetical protein